MRLSALLLVLVAAGCPSNNSGGADLSPELDLTTTADQSTPADLVPGVSGIGTPCTGSGQGSCADGQTCLSDSLGFVGGYCSQSCANGALCPGDATCAQSFCFRKCTSTVDCRAPDYECGPGKFCVPVAVDPSGVKPGTNDGGACVQPIRRPGGDGGVSLFGPNLQVSSSSGQPFAAEPYMAVDPVAKNIVVAYIDIVGSGTTIGVAPSASDGVTFSAPLNLPINTTVNKNNTQSDPIVAVDTKGTFFITWIGFDRSTTSSPTNMTIYVARSSDGGATFPDLFVVSPSGEWATGGFLDKPWISVSPVDDSVYVTWNRGTSTSPLVDIRMARSTDHGATWSTPTTISDSSARSTYSRNLCQTTVNKNGNPVAVWVEILNERFGATANRVYLQRFNTDGTRNGANVLVTKTLDSPAFDDPSVATDFDATNAVDNVYVGFISGTPSGAWDVKVAASRDGGATFASSVKANDDTTCATHFHHQIAVDQKGNVHAAWYDNRYLEANVFLGTSGPVDAMNPLAFGKNSFVNDTPFKFVTGRGTTEWLGDYLGLTTAGDEIYATWTDNRISPASRIFFAKGTLP